MAYRSSLSPPSSSSCVIVFVGLVFPLDLELDFFLVVGALMLDRVSRSHWDIDALAGNLNLEALSGFERIREAPKLVDEFRQCVGLFDVAFQFGQLSLPRGALNEVVLQEGAHNLVRGDVRSSDPRIPAGLAVELPAHDEAVYFQHADGEMCYPRAFDGEPADGDGPDRACTDRHRSECERSNGACA
jgi:hypothetical protein